ncbi:NAD(P)-dependent oxidoreductase [Roseicitreum antarcticum]|uniref:3-hydroxyisobutyrate dehydrogenase n=1 Tax=Roseicitreum antarcticum TaxID=564137 RepID=A0A1H3AJ69_9RHOB|nr:NAD(P)-dependent oxidoreductase [Roseicitreum antarcticum]SDX29757.1 3-hydroxyisobutyrate dehydrogenase [Roseicitreum antarcticum]
MRCAVVGLGNMGAGIAAKLAQAGLLGAVWDSREAALAPFSDCKAGIRAVAECNILFFAVPGSAQISDLFETGILDGPPGRVMVDLTTSDPRTTKDLAARAQACGAAYLDAGMSGGAAGAQSGSLTLMIGGSDDALARAQPALDQIAAQIFHVGPAGAGHTMKLVHNMICHTIFLATTEGCRAATAAGIPLERAVEVLNAGNARSFVSERRFPDHIVSGTYDGRSVAGNLAKDLDMARALFADLDQASPYVNLTAALLAQAGPLGMMTQDFTRLYLAYDQLVGQLDTPSAQ